MVGAGESLLRRVGRVPAPVSEDEAVELTELLQLRLVEERNIGGEAIYYLTRRGVALVAMLIGQETEALSWSSPSPT
jgi:hypothetical protein